MMSCLTWIVNKIIIGIVNYVLKSVFQKSIIEQDITQKNSKNTSDKNCIMVDCESKDWPECPCWPMFTAGGLAPELEDDMAMWPGLIKHVFFLLASCLHVCAVCCSDHKLQAPTDISNCAWGSRCSRDSESADDWPQHHCLPKTWSTGYKVCITTHQHCWKTFLVF